MVNNPPAIPAKISSPITPTPPFTLRSITPIREGFQMSKSLKAAKLPTMAISVA